MTYVLIAIVAIIGICMDSEEGKYILAFGVAAAGLWAISYLTGTNLFYIFAKGCLVIIVLILVFTLIASIFNR